MSTEALPSIGRLSHDDLHHELDYSLQHGYITPEHSRAIKKLWFYGGLAESMESATRPLRSVEDSPTASEIDKESANVALEVYAEISRPFMHKMTSHLKSIMNPPMTSQQHLEDFWKRACHPREPRELWNVVDFVQRSLPRGRTIHKQRSASSSGANAASQPNGSSLAAESTLRPLTGPSTALPPTLPGLDALDLLYPRQTLALPSRNMTDTPLPGPFSP